MKRRQKSLEDGRSLRAQVALASDGGKTLTLAEAFPAPATGLDGLVKAALAAGSPVPKLVGARAVVGLDPLVRFDGVAADQALADRLALWLGASLGVFHSLGGGDAAAISADAASTFSDLCAVASDVDAEVAAAWEDYCAAAANVED